MIYMTKFILLHAEMPDVENDEMGWAPCLVRIKDIKAVHDKLVCVIVEMRGKRDNLVVAETVEKIRHRINMAGGEFA